MGAVIIGIVAATRTNSDGPINSPLTRGLHIASAAIFLALTVLQAVQTAILVRSDLSGMLSFIFYFIFY